MKIQLSIIGARPFVPKKSFCFTIILFSFCALVSCTKEAVSNPESSNLLRGQNLTAEALTNATSTAPMFGAWISSYTVDQKMSACSDIGVGYVRDAIELKSFTGKSSSVDAYLNKGYKVLLNLVYQNPSGGNPAPFPSDMTEYRNLLNKVLDKYTPTVAVIENEPTTDKFHSGPIENYITELKTAVNVCKQRGIKVADGALNLQWVQVIMNGYSSTDPNYIETKKLLEAYKTIDLDYINIHTHAPFTKNDSPDVFPQNVAVSVANYIRTQTGKQVMCNEYNQYNTSTALMASAVNAFAAGGYAYFIAHSNDNDGKGKSLYTGAQLTEIGVSYKNSIK